MGKGTNKRTVNGWLIVDKPAGMTSTFVVNKVKWAFNAKKAGHSGTLDPTATGLLAIALGEATKAVPHVTDALKAYRFIVNLGAATNTDDTEGEVTEISDSRPTDDEIKAALPPFVGDVMQIPPKFSAVKIDGKRAYKLARDGDDPKIAARPLFVDSLEFISRPSQDQVELELVCGKGGYVRAIARDLGQTLGCFGHVEILRRTWSGPFDLEHSVSWDWIVENKRTTALDDSLISIEDSLIGMPELPCRPEAAARMKNGNPGMVIASNVEYGDTAWASCDGQAIAIGVYKAGELHPDRVFVRSDE